MAVVKIAFEAPECGQRPRPSGARPIDLVHLARQTGGDKALEAEVLAIFAKQARSAVCRIPDMEAQDRSRLVHTILGSARGVGAFEVARCAGDLEREPESATALAAFTRAVTNADNFILGLSR